MTEPQTAIPMNRGADTPLDVAVPVSDKVSSEQALTFSSKLLDALKWAVSFPAMLGVFLIGRVFCAAREFVVDPDVWWHIKVGQDLLRTHHWPTTDPYSFTALGTPWIAYEWLGEIVLALMYGAGGVISLCICLIAFGSVIILSL